MATISRTVLREQVKDILLQRIASGELKPGERLVETRIAQELGTSQAPVREALRDLQLLRLVESEPFRGSRVRVFGEEELIDVYPVRAALEELAARLAAEKLGGDVSARDLQFADGQWTRGKSPDTFCPVGPLVPKSEVPDPHALAIRAIVSGETLQDSNTSNLIFGIDEIISYASQTSTLEAGDLILTGTPAGVGVFRNPKRLLRPGDTVTIQIDGVGEITNPVIAG